MHQERPRDHFSEGKVGHFYPINGKMNFEFFEYILNGTICRPYVEGRSILHRMAFVQSKSIRKHEVQDVRRKFKKHACFAPYAPILNVSNF